MVQRKRTYKKRAYKKRTYKRRYYKRRYYKRRYYKSIKKPEIHISEVGQTITAFNAGVGEFINLTQIGQSNTTGQYDEVEYTLNQKSIEGTKIRLKYLYMKGYIKVGANTEADADDFNCKLMIFRWKRNTTNEAITWNNLLNKFILGVPSTWTENNRLDMMYTQDWRNDIKINFYKKVKNLYRKYDDANNIIPFKIRVPLYDCVLTCDFDQSTTTAYTNPSTNGLYFTFLSNKYDNNTILNYKYKIYYTDY